MTVRKIRGAALALGVLLLGVGVGAAPASACEGMECQSAGQPISLKRFMREQAASTRTPEAMQATRGKTAHRSRTARSGGAHGKTALSGGTHVKTAHAHSPRRRTVTAAHDAQPAAAPRDATALAFAAQGSTRDDANVQVVSVDELNDIDRAAGPAPAETTGNSPAPRDVLTVAQDVQMVVENDFNEIDRKSAELVRPAAAVAVTTSEVTPHSAPATTWMQWLWSAIGAGFVVLAGVARYLLA